MSLADVTRKRFRNGNEEDVNEFAPLSKRINNLHINNGALYVAKHSESKLLMKTEDMCQGSSYALPVYSPELSPQENPVYYEANRLLHQLYMERTCRQHTHHGYHT